MEKCPNKPLEQWKPKEKKKKGPKKTPAQKFLEQTKQNNKLPPMKINRHLNEDHKAVDIYVENCNLIVGGKSLLEDTQLKLTQGRKYGLIGRNGVGKTSFMMALVRREFQGLPNHVQILLAEQEVEGTQLTAVDYVLEVDSERTELLARFEELSKNNQEDCDDEISNIAKQLELIDANKAESKAQEILGGLGFTAEMMNSPTLNLSGGWRMRVSLARALFVNSDVLLLDEPTNHLDLDATIWLETYVQNCESCVIIVSHDRAFLNGTVDEIIHFDQCKLQYYKGDYDTFERERFNARKLQHKMYNHQQEEIKHIKHFIERFRANCARASQAQSRVKQLERMDMLEDIIADPEIRFILPNPEPLNPPRFLKVEEGEFGYTEDNIVLKNINFTVDKDSRYALVGPNGCGKSTFLKLLLGELTLNSGLQWRNHKLRCNVFTQHHADSLNLELSPLEQLKKDYPDEKEENYRRHLSKFGLTPDMVSQPSYLLSGGQKSRVAFALAVYQQPHMMILDEPTNHLDMDAVSALILALNNYEGGILVVSHDQHFISSVCDKIYYIKNRQISEFDGDFVDYRNATINKTI